MTVPVWPRTVLVPTEAGPPNVAPNNTSGGVGFDGSEQIIGNSPGRWTMSYKNIAVRTAAHVLAWNGLAAQLQGRLNPVQIPLYDRQREPQAGVTASAHGAIAVGAVTGTIQVNAGGDVLQAGQHFSMDQVNLYRIAQITGITTDGDHNHFYAVVFWPPARRAIPDGHALIFNDVYFQVRLATDAAMSAMSLALLKTAAPSIDFVEAL